MSNIPWVLSTILNLRLGCKCAINVIYPVVRPLVWFVNKNVNFVKTTRRRQVD